MIVGQRYRIIGQKYRLLSQDTEPLVKNTEYILKDTEPLVKNTEYLVKKYGVFDRGKSWTAPQRPVGPRLPHQATVTHRRVSLPARVNVQIVSLWQTHSWASAVIILC